MNYNCPSHEEFEAYARMPRVRGYMDRHARRCPECARRLAPLRRRVMLIRGGRFLGLLAVLSMLGLSDLQSGPGLVSPSSLLRPTATATPEPEFEGLAMNGHRFLGGEAGKIRAAFENARFYEIREGDTLAHLVGRAYGQDRGRLWHAVLEFNNHPENPRRFERRYRKPLQERELMAGELIQLPPKDVLFLIVNRTEMEAVASCTQ